jgi:hypothetical protein
VTGPNDNDPIGVDPAAELEAYIAQTEARGEPVPPEARAMLARLRELMAALRDLTASLGERAEHGERTSPPKQPDEDDHHD